MSAILPLKVIGDKKVIWSNNEKLRNLRLNKEDFDRQLPDLKMRVPDQFVLMVNGKLVSIGPSFKEIAAVARSKYSGLAITIYKVSDTPTKLD